MKKRKDCEKNLEVQKIINVDNIKKIIKKAISEKIFVIYLSSNAVFDGKKQFYNYSDKTSPITKYGEFKDEVEKYIVSTFLKSTCILRLTKVITEKNDLIEKWKKAIKLNKKITTFSNIYISPVKIERVIDIISRLIDKKQGGIYQLSGDKEISYTEYAREYFKNNKKALNLINPENKNKNSHRIYNSLTERLP